MSLHERADFPSQKRPFFELSVGNGDNERVLISISLPEANPLFSLAINDKETIHVDIPENVKPLVKRAALLALPGKIDKTLHLVALGTGKDIIKGKQLTSRERTIEAVKLGAQIMSQPHPIAKIAVAGGIFAYEMTTEYKNSRKKPPPFII